jgi:uncharacterized protein (UPF0333 family)
MAARENQGIQLALIIFVILTIILIVTTYMFFNYYQKEKEANKALAADNTSKDNTAQAANKESGLLKMTIGAADTEKAADVDAKAVKDMEKYGKGLTNDNKNYRFLVEQLGTELKTANTRIVEVSNEKKELEAKLKANDEAGKAEMAKYSEKYAAAEKELKEEREKFGQARQKMTNDNGDLVKKFDAKRKEHEELTKQSTDQIATLNADKGKLRGTLDRINEENERKTKANEVPDGKVTWVNQVTRLVWINLGSQDGLRRQITFSVFDREDSNPAESQRKGKIEVVRLMEPHMAEARIVDDDLSNPIMPGDHIFSPTWEPGRPEHFALAGMMDINGDGESDRQQIRDLITLNGGIIDAEEDGGKKTGHVTINTKYVVLGEEPKQEAKLSGYGEIFDEAKIYGIRTLSVHEFLDYMGYRPEERTVKLGRTARPTDFKPRLPEGVQRVMPGTARSKDLRKPVTTDRKKSAE